MEREKLLYIRLGLKDKATECGREETILEVEEALRVRFGLLLRQAREKLRALRYYPMQSVHKFGAEARRFVQLALPNVHY